MMQHYFSGNHYALCCPREDIQDTVDLITHNDLEQIRRMPSFRLFVESQHNPQSKINLITNDDYLKSILPEMMNNIHDYFFYFHTGLSILNNLVGDLPKAPLGKQLREIYSNAISNNITATAEYKECMQLLNFLSKNEFLDKLTVMLNYLNATITMQQETLSPNDYQEELCIQKIKEIYDNIYIYMRNINTASFDIIKLQTAEEEPDYDSARTHRSQMREKLLKMSKQKKPTSEYEMVRAEIVSYISVEVFQKFVFPLNLNAAIDLPFYELFLFSDVSEVKNHIVGTPRASLHSALNNPAYYLQCECCQISTSDSIMSSMPDICIAYKLHLECGRLVNLFDWLQAFRSVIVGVTGVEDIEIEVSKEVEPEIQARFTRCVAELQHLGYIRSSNKKTDHVTRLTW